MKFSIIDTKKSDLEEILILNQLALPAVSSVTIDEMANFLDIADYFKSILIENIVAGFLIALHPGKDYHSLNYKWFEKRYKSFIYVDRIVIGSSYRGNAPTDYLLGTWWNHSIVKAPAQISAVSGRIIQQKVTFIGKEVITFQDKTYNTLHFNFSSTDEKLSKGKKLNTDVWYDEKSLNWVKASFKKKGNWVYKLVTLE